MTPALIGVHSLGAEPFTSRLFVSTTEHWSSNAEKVIEKQQIPVQRIGIAELESSPFDWSRFDPDQLSMAIRKYHLAANRSAQGMANRSAQGMANRGPRL